METVQHITRGKTGGAGFGVAAAAKELGQMRDTIKETMEEMVNQAMDEKLGGSEHDSGKEHSLAMCQLREDRVAHKKEIEDLSRVITEFTKQIREPKSVNAAAAENNENHQPGGSSLKRKKVEMKWTPGLKFDKNWSHGKKRQYNKLFKENSPEGWKKEQLERLERQKQALE